MLSGISLSEYVESPSVKTQAAVLLSQSSTLPCLPFQRPACIPCVCFSGHNNKNHSSHVRHYGIVFRSSN